jgi:uncharacterized protein YndB with AHSA1/START domain
MLARPEKACFLIADISGYTSYLAGVELDHAQDIIADLMDTVVKSLRPSFRIAKFEGDAVFLFAVGDKFDGSLLQDSIESAYFAFRKRLRNIEQATSCQCKACHGMQQLDLKFVAHHGEFIRQRMAGRDELAGRDVIVVHRLLKNSVKDRLGGHAYVLYSDACLQVMEVDPASQQLLEHKESIEILGKLKCWVCDIEGAWATEKDRRRNVVTRSAAAYLIEFDLVAARPIVWDYFTSPGKRPKWRGADEVRETVEKVSGRRVIGTVNHCMHGPHAIIEEVLDWRPFDYLTLTTLLPMPAAPKVLMTYAFLESDGSGTHVEIRIGKAMPRDQPFVEQVVAEFRNTITREIEGLSRLLGQEDCDPEDLQGSKQKASGE